MFQRKPTIDDLIQHAKQGGMEPHGVDPLKKLRDKLEKNNDPIIATLKDLRPDWYPVVASSRTIPEWKKYLLGNARSGKIKPDVMSQDWMAVQRYCRRDPDFRIDMLRTPWKSLGRMTIDEAVDLDLEINVPSDLQTEDPNIYCEDYTRNPITRTAMPVWACTKFAFCKSSGTCRLRR
jgi:hypothetical protein